MNRTFHLSILLLLIFSSCKQYKKMNVKSSSKKTTMGTTKNKMTIEIWSDIMCPFCYLGKRKFENALSQFPDKNHVQVVWKSFQLMPSLKTDTTINIHEFLSKEKGWSLEQAKKMNNQLSQMGEPIGLEYNFDSVVVANSFSAHRFLHFAKENGKQNEAEEHLFKAFFTDGKNIDSYSTLIELGTAIGLNRDSLTATLENGEYSEEVKADINEGQQLGINGVPFFIFNRKYAISGAQETSVFLKTLEKAFSEWKEDNPGALLEITNGKACTKDGKCD